MLPTPAYTQPERKVKFTLTSVNWLLSLLTPTNQAAFSGSVQPVRKKRIGYWVCLKISRPLVNGFDLVHWGLLKIEEVYSLS